MESLSAFSTDWVIIYFQEIPLWFLKEKMSIILSQGGLSLTNFLSFVHISYYFEGVILAILWRFQVKIMEVKLQKLQSSL